MLAGRTTSCASARPIRRALANPTTVVVDTAEVGLDQTLIGVSHRGSHFPVEDGPRLTGTLGEKWGSRSHTGAVPRVLMAGKKDPKLMSSAMTAPAVGLFLEAHEVGGGRQQCSRLLHLRDVEAAP